MPASEIGHAPEVVAPVTPVRYDRLGEQAQQEMVRSAVLELERLHFETKLNITINSPDHVMNFDDGTSQKLSERLEMVEEKLARMKDDYGQLL